MIKRGQLHNQIAWAKAEVSETGEVITLETKDDSYCHFFTPFRLDGDEITLRLDWGSIDANSHPTLDADFKKISTGKMCTREGDRFDAHHTQAQGKGERIYCWIFRDRKRTIKVTIGWLLEVEFAAGFSSSASLTVEKPIDK